MSRLNSPSSLPHAARSVLAATPLTAEPKVFLRALSDRPVAGKTGTGENYADAWFCGYVPQLVACVWVGYPGREIPLQNVEGLPAVFGGSLPAEIWHDFMGPAVANLKVQNFPTPTLSGTIISGTDTYSPYYPTTG